MTVFVLMTGNKDYYGPYFNSIYATLDRAKYEAEKLHQDFAINKQRKPLTWIQEGNYHIADDYLIQEEVVQE